MVEPPDRDPDTADQLDPVDYAQTLFSGLKTEGRVFDDIENLLEYLRDGHVHWQDETGEWQTGLDNET
ncbi:hypothetical protein [Streptomyces atriruber]|uniref:hypothetical protein n=1 Tax=Streptomyces atriruber TaxID=545121 RepID=UPI0006E2CC22|nr:hypothetical protein [Streptomyces atriruber]